MKLKNQPLELKDLQELERLVVIDFEGTGKRAPTPLEISKAPRGWKPPGIIIEIGGVELIREGERWVKGETFHTFVKPDGPIEPKAIQVHGIHPAQLKLAPRFIDLRDRLIDFLGDAGIVAHAYENERSYLDYEYARAGIIQWGEEAIPIDRWLCSQRAFARQFPLTSKSLDSCLDRLWIDRSGRFEKHGALLDADLTADVLVVLEAMAVKGLDVAQARAVALAESDDPQSAALEAMR